MVLQEDRTQNRILGSGLGAKTRVVCYLPRRAIRISVSQRMGITTAICLIIAIYVITAIITTITIYNSNKADNLVIS